jgi:hypothetical protein
VNQEEAADYEAEFSQSGTKAVIASAEKFIEKAAGILGIISDCFASHEMQLNSPG